MPSSRIRWDRIARTALLLVIVAVLYLYIGPTRAWIGAYQESGVRKAEVATLRAEHDRLVSQRNYLKAPATAELEARKRGMVRGAEKLYVVKGLPDR